MIKTFFAVLVSCLLLTGGCMVGTSGGNKDEQPLEPSLPDAFTGQRARMVERQIVARGITDTRVLNALRKVPRHCFVLPEQGKYAYSDFPLSIGYDQTISQPYIVALMTELLAADTHSVILEIGTGSGYQAAVLGELCRAVYSVEIIPELAHNAKTLLDRLGYRNITIRAADGYQGWPEHAPFDGIIITAAPPEIPAALIDQLSEGGTMVVPVGTDRQILKVIKKTRHGTIVEDSIPVRFVPMVRNDTTR